MKTEFIWYNPAEKEYQMGDKKSYLDILKNSNQSENFVILDTFEGLSASFKEKLEAKLRFLNSARRTNMFDLMFD